MRGLADGKPEQLFALDRSKTLDASRFCDPDLIEKTTSLDLPECWQRLQQDENLHLPDGLVARGLIDRVGEREPAFLELPFDGGSFFANPSGLFEGGGTLLSGERRRLRHGLERISAACDGLRPVPGPGPLQATLPHGTGPRSTDLPQGSTATH